MLRRRDGSGFWCRVSGRAVEPGNPAKGQVWLIDDITHLVPGRDDLLGALDRGDLDATLLDLRRLDAYRAAHPDSKIAGSGYYYPIGVNRGYVGLASEAALLVAVNKALTDLQAAGTIAGLAQAAGLTYLPPREPVILGDVWLKILGKQ